MTGGVTMGRSDAQRWSWGSAVGGAPTWFVLAAVLLVTGLIGFVMYDASLPQPPRAWASPFVVRETYPITVETVPRDTPTIAFMGTAATAGYGAGEDGGIGDGYAVLVAQELGWPSDNTAVVATGYTRGNGADGPYLDQIAQVVRYRPDVVVIEGGSNDMGSPTEEVQADASDVFIALRTALPDAIIVAFLDTNSPVEPVEELDRIRAAVRAAAEERGVLAVDPSTWLDADTEFADDGRHPNEDGHQVLADRLTPIIEAAYREKLRESEGP